MGATVDRGSLDAMLGTYCTDLGEKLGDLFVEVARHKAPYDAGALVDSITADGALLAGTHVTNRVSATAEYALYQDEGTGIYGPTGERITPHDSDGVLAFFWKNAGVQVFARSVAGSPATHFWTDTVADWPTIVSSV